MKKAWFLTTFLLPLVLFLFFQDVNVVNDQLIQKIDKELSFLGWVASASVSFMAFAVLFLTIILDKSIFKNASKLESFYKPYHLESKELKQIINTYLLNNNIPGLTWFFYTLSTLICLLNCFWSVCVSYYADYSLWPFDIKLFADFTVIIDLITLLLPMAFWISTNLVLLFILMILDKKSMFKKSVLLNPDNLLDIEFLKNGGKADIQEIFYKIGPAIEVYSDDSQKKLYLKQEVQFFNYAIILKIYSPEEKLLYKLYFKKNNSIDQTMLAIESPDKDLNKQIYTTLLNKECKCEVHLYDYKGEKVAKYLLKINPNNEDFAEYNIFRVIPFVSNARNLEEKNILELNDMQCKIEKI